MIISSELKRSTFYTLHLFHQCNRGHRPAECFLSKADCLVLLSSDCTVSHYSAMPTTPNCLHLNGHTEEISLTSLLDGCSSPALLARLSTWIQSFFHPCWRSIFFAFLFCLPLHQNPWSQILWCQTWFVFMHNFPVHTHNYALIVAVYMFCSTK